VTVARTRDRPGGAADARWDAVLAGAGGVLGRNWRRLHTVPATGLYPHQWSWDSAFVAIGLRHLSPRRAQQELESLTGAQWSDGRLPQIVFDGGRDDDYSPGAGFWNSSSLPGAPAVATAGLVQPPVHAWAALLVHRSDPVESARRRFLPRIYPRLLAWHDYLATRRTRSGTGLACLVHPWESGMDNAPAWDPVLAEVSAVRRADPTIAELDVVPRPDLLHAADGERPTSQQYRDYLYLAARYRDHGCDDHDREYPFLVEDPAFNALWAMSEHALAAIAELLEAPVQRHRAAAQAITGALQPLFDHDLNLYLARDLGRDALLPGAGVGGLIPLLLPGLPRRAELLATLLGPRFALGRSVLVPSFDLTDPGFEPARYWRGPSWFNTAWLLVQALTGAGRSDLARPLATELAARALDGGFPEYLDPGTGQPHGTRSFSWTAALALDCADALRHDQLHDRLPFQSPRRSSSRLPDGPTDRLP
jgi:hypothetical protein